MAGNGVNAAACHHAHASYAQREVDVSAHPSPTGSHVVIVVHGPRAPAAVIEYIVDSTQPADALRVGLGYAREFIDGGLH
jgi:hypothetical protein